LSCVLATVLSYKSKAQYLVDSELSEIKSHLEQVATNEFERNEAVPYWTSIP